MSTEETDLDLIERFIGGKLSRTELEDFETRMEEDHEFARKFRLRKTFPSLFKAEGPDAIAMTPAAVPAEIPKKQKPHSSKSRYFVIPGIFLLIALALAMVYFLLFRPGRPGGEIAGNKGAVAKVEKPAEKGKAREQLHAADQMKAAVEASEQPPAGAKPSESLPAPGKTSEQPPAGVKPAEPLPAASKPTEQMQVAGKTGEPVQVPVKAGEQPPAQMKANEPPPAPKLAPATRNGIILLSPADNISVKRGEEVVFTWKQSTDTFTNFYIISESSNKLAWWRGIRPGIREIKVPAVNFKPGRFYWYVGSKDIRRTLIVRE